MVVLFYFAACRFEQRARTRHAEFLERFLVRFNDAIAADLKSREDWLRRYRERDREPWQE